LQVARDGHAGIAAIVHCGDHQVGAADVIAASKYFPLQVDSRGEKADAYVLNLKLFQEQKLLLETKAKLSKASPLVIRGPQVGDGQLVIVLVVQ